MISLAKKLLMLGISQGDLLIPKRMTLRGRYPDYLINSVQMVGKFQKDL
jgi:hypothetical protein